MGGTQAIENSFLTLLEKGPRKVTPFFVPMSIINLAAGQVGIRFGFRGPNTSAVTACATGNTCIGDAYRIIQRGEADAMLPEEQKRQSAGWLSPGLPLHGRFPPVMMIQKGPAAPLTGTGMAF